MTANGDRRAEFRLLLSCSRSRIDCRRSETIESLLGQDIDWTLLARTALAHGVAPLLYRALERVAAAPVPQEFMAALRVNFEANRDRTHALVRELLDILVDLKGRGVEAVPFKGPILAALAYGDLALRTAGDLEFLVRPGDVTAVCDLLVARGYHQAPEMIALTPAQDAAFRKHQSQYLFYRDTDRIAVEPHWRISPRSIAVDLDYDGLWRRVEETLLAGEPVPGFAVEDVLTILCEHGSKHQWVQLRWICDIAELVGRHGDIDWQVVLQGSRAHGIERMVLLGLALADRLLGIEIPDTVRDRMAADRPAGLLARQAATNLFREGNTTPGPAEITLFRVRMRERARDKVRYVTRTMSAPMVRHFGLMPLPPSMFFLTYPIKIVHDYLLLPVWVLAKRAMGREGRRRAADGDRAPAKADIRAGWGNRAAAWVRWSDAAAGPPRRVDRALLDAAGLAPGQKVLDLASGVGDPALAAARRLNGDGVLVYSDFAPEMVAAAEARLRTVEGPDLFGCAADIEALPFRAGTFDAVLCRLGIMFCPRLGLALSEAYRVLKPGARAAFLVWGPIEDNAIFDVLYRSVVAAMDEAWQDDPLSQFRFGTADSLGAEMRGAGFEEVAEREMRFTVTAPADGRFWQAGLEMLVGAWFEGLPDAGKSALDRSLRGAFAPYLEGFGYRLPGHLRIVAGARPEPGR